MPDQVYYPPMVPWKSAVPLLIGTTLAAACTSHPSNPTIPTVTLSPPVPTSPNGGVSLPTVRPTLTVTNSVATGNSGTVTYRFEVSALSSFANDPVNTFAVDGVAQGASTTSWTLNRDLAANELWYWHARATNGTVTSDYSSTATFRTVTACSYAVSPTGVSAASGGGNFSVAVSTGTGCTWTAVSNSSFITINAGSSGTGSGTVAFTVGTNGSSNRTGTLTIAGQTVTVSQAGGGF